MYTLDVTFFLSCMNPQKTKEVDFVCRCAAAIGIWIS